MCPGAHAPSSAYRAFRMTTHRQLVSRFPAAIPALPHSPTSWCHDAQGQITLPNKLQDTIYRPSYYLEEGRLRKRKSKRAAYSKNSVSIYKSTRHQINNHCNKNVKFRTELVQFCWFLCALQDTGRIQSRKQAKRRTVCRTKNYILLLCGGWTRLK